MTRLARRLAVDLYQALAYRRRDVPHRAGLGAIRIRSHVVTGRWEPLWRYDDDLIWTVFPVEALGRLELCTVRSQVEQLMRGGAR